MANKVVSIGFNGNDIAQAVKDIEQYKRELNTRIQRFVEGLATIGVQEASIRFTTAIYDGVNDVTVSLSGKGNEYIIAAKGNAVAFIEFGTGVSHNSAEPYPYPRPGGIVGIGEYGKGKGKRKAWYYMGDPGSNGELQPNGVVKTRGNPAAMPMWYATEEMKNSIVTLAREVFG